MNRNQIKYLAAAAMAVDHAARAFVPAAAWAGLLMRFFGRLTGPVMAYFLAEGYIHTCDVRRYALRLALFAAASWVPYSLFETARWPSAQLGVGYTLLLGLLAIWMWDRAPLSDGEKALLTAGLCLLSAWGDWPVTDVLWPLCFYLYRDDARRKWGLCCLIAAGYCAVVLLEGGAPWQTRLFAPGVFAAPLLLRAYNGEGGSRRPFHKWFFYGFYPAHLLALYLLVRAVR